MKVAFRSSFLKEIQKLKDADLKANIMNIIVDVEESGAFIDIKNFKKLKGYTSYFRIKSGKYRIGLKWEDVEQTLYFVTFDHRKDIYKNFP